MKVLVTGGCGVIGSHIARRLIDSGCEVSIIDACGAPRNEWIARRLPEAKIATGRLEEGAGIHLVDAVDAVIHCAASTGIPHSVLHPDSDWSSNVDATRVLLEALRKTPKPTVVLSSVKPYRVPCYYGESGPYAGAGARGLREDDVLEPDEPYAASKASQSMLAMAYARSYGIPVVTFRCSNLAGCAPPHGPRHGAWTWLALSAAIGRPLEVQGTGQQTRDVLMADDVFTACMAALENAERLRGRVFNIGGGATNRISIGEAVSALVEMAGGGEIRTAPARAMDDMHVFVDHFAFTEETGWRPAIAVRDGLRMIFDWAKTNRDELRALYEGV